MKKAIQVQNKIDIENAEFIEEATELLKTGVFKSDLNLKKNDHNVSTKI